MHIGGKSKKRSSSPANSMNLRLLSAEQAAVAQHDFFCAIAFYTLVCRRCYKGERLVTSSFAVPRVNAHVMLSEHTFCLSTKKFIVAEIHTTAIRIHTTAIRIHTQHSLLRTHTLPLESYNTPTHSPYNFSPLSHFQEEKEFSTHLHTLKQPAIFVCVCSTSGKEQN